MCAWDFWVFGVLVYMRPTYNQRKEFLKLIRKYLKGNATEEQLDFLSFFVAYNAQNKIFVGINSGNDQDQLNIHVKYT